MRRGEMVSGVVGVLVFGMAGGAWAASVGVPTGTEEHRWEVTAEYSHTFEREFEAPAQETDDISESNQYHARIAYAWFPWLQPFIKLGAADYEQSQRNTNILGVGRRSLDFDYDLGFSWGGGLRGRYDFTATGGGWDWASGWFVGYVAEYLRSDNDLDGVTHAGRTATGVTGDVSIEEWQVAGYLGKTFELGGGSLRPYVGGRWSELEVESDKDFEWTDSVDGTIGGSLKSESDDNAGVFVGLSYELANRWRLGVEGRFIDEEAITAQASYTF